MAKGILCADRNSFGRAINVLESSSVVVLDCEGKDLGCQGGSLSLINLRGVAPKNSKTYCIDTITLDDNELQPLFDIIQSPNVKKIVFDGRMDFAELYHGHSITMNGVIDLQLVDINSRRLRGEDRKQQLARLFSYLPRGQVFGDSGCCAAVEKLNGLEECLREHELVKKGQKGKGSVPHTAWLDRPLPKEYLDYAARDIELIAMLYFYFKKEGYLDNELHVESARYISMWWNARRGKIDPFTNHPLLPLQILDHNDTSLTQPCRGCQRELPAPGYSKSAWKTASKRYCWVCRAIKLHPPVRRKPRASPSRKDTQIGTRPRTHSISNQHSTLH